MASRTNVNDRHFLDDLAYNEDYRRDANAAEQGVREAAVDICRAGAVIFDGLEVSDGTPAGYLKVSAGRARDKDKYHILVPSDEDNVEPADTTSDTLNYVAIRHKWSDTSAANAVKTGRHYNRVRADGYEIDVSTTRHDEADGWVNLARAEWSGSTWIVYTNYPDRSRGPARDVAFWTYTYAGVLADATVDDLMFHHGLNKDIFAVPFDLVIHRLTFAADVPGVGLVTFGLFINQVEIVTFDVDPTNMRTISFFDSSGYVACGVNDTLQIALTNVSGYDGPTDISVVVAGYRVGG
ncbi:MAG: hypothetical protein V3W11_06370 [bacterium]